MSEPTIEAVMLADKLSTAAILFGGLWVVWRRYIASSDKLIAALEGQTSKLQAGLAEVRAAVEAGLAGLGGRVDQHARTLEAHERQIGEHGRTLARHAEIIGAMSAASGTYSRPRVLSGGEQG